MDEPINSNIFGGFAAVIIKYDGSLRQLAARLAAALNVESFVIETGQAPPHEEVGLAEAMGWEVWLNPPSGASDSFHLRMETSHSISEICEGRMFDLSPWLARLVTTLCEVEAYPESPRR